MRIYGFLRLDAQIFLGFDLSEVSHVPVYALFSRFFPRSFGAKLMAAVLIGQAVALAAALGSGAAPLIVTAGAAVGAALSAALIGGLLVPVQKLATTVDIWGRTGRVVPLPEEYGDDLGRLLARTNSLIARAQRSLDVSWSEEDSDPLTGALNRGGATRLLQDAGAGWLIAFDLDHFGKVNDTLGREGGNRVLRDLVQAGAGILRQDDMLARTGPDEFLVFLPGATRAVAERISRRIGKVLSHEIDSGTLTLSATIAITDYPGGGDVDDVFQTLAKELQKTRAEGVAQVGQGGTEAA